MKKGDFSASYCHLSTLKALSGLCSALLYLFLPFFFPPLWFLCASVWLCCQVSACSGFSIACLDLIFFERSALCKRRMSPMSSSAVWGILQYGKLTVWCSSLARATKLTRSRMHYLCTSCVRYSAEQFGHDRWGKRVVPGCTYITTVLKILAQQISSRQAKGAD